MSKPIYLQIKEIIKSEIDDKQSNEVIESERALSNRLKASRMTVRKALDELVEEGYLYRERNRGTFVSNKTFRKINTADPTIDVDNIDHRLINFDVKYSVSEEILDRLELSLNDDHSMIRAVRIAYKNKRPEKIEEFFIIRSFISEKIINKFDKLLDLNYYLEEGSMNQSLIPMIVPPQYAAILQLAIDTPIIKIEGIVRTKSGEPFIYYCAYNNPKVKKITMTL